MKMNFLLSALLVSFVPCLISASNKGVWYEDVTNKDSLPITIHVINTTCWNIGNFTKTRFYIEGRTKIRFRSTEDFTSSRCSGAATNRNLFLQVWMRGPTTNFVRIGEQGRNCSHLIFNAQGELAGGVYGDCSYPELNGIIWDPYSLKSMFGGPLNLVIEPKSNKHHQMFHEESHEADYEKGD